MPAITLGVAEIESRLQNLQKRFNILVIIGVCCAALTLVFGLVALSLALGWYHDQATRRVLLWALPAVTAMVAAAAAWEVYRRWIDLEAAAELVDDRAQLANRLTTLLHLRKTTRVSRLAPVLVAQMVGLMPLCEPQAVAPLRIPRSAYTLALALLALILANWVSPETPPPPAPAPAPQQQARASRPEALPAPVEPPSTAQRGTGEGSGGGAADGGNGNLQADDAGARDEDASTNDADSAPTLPQRLLALLPDEAQRALTRRFQAQQLDLPHQLEANEERRAGTDGSPEAAGKQEQAQAQDDAADPNAGPPKSGKAGTEGRDGKQQDQGKPTDAQPNHDSAKSGDDAHGEASAANQRHDDKAPPAGSGSSPSDLMDANGSGAALANQEPPKTFKLTITSFLQAAAQAGAKAKRGAKRVAGAGEVVPETTHTTPSEQQLRDDVMRKAEIPPEYEDLVRRVYSERSIADEH